MAVTPTPLFPMETTKAKILQALKINPNAEFMDSMTTIQTPYKILWRPNNYRRQIKVKPKDNSTIEKVKSTIPTFISYGNHNKLLFIKNYMGVTIQYGKDKLIAIHSQEKRGDDKLTYLIQSYTIEEVDRIIETKSKEIINKLDSALLSFARQFNIILETERPTDSRGRGEDWLRGEEYIDKIPADLIIHDDTFKKVYQKGVEFLGDNTQPSTARIRNYIRNRAIENVSPQISDQLSVINEKVDLIENKITPVIDRLATQINLHLDILEGIRSALNREGIKPITNRKALDIINQAKSIEDFNKADFIFMIQQLDQEEKAKLSDLIIQKFNISD